MKYGVKLLTYDGQEFDTWVWDGDTRFETTIIGHAEQWRDHMQAKNPKGQYIVDVIVD